MRQLHWVPALALLTLCGVAHAQPPGPGAHRGPPPLHLIVQHRGAELGLEAAVLEEIERIGEESEEMLRPLKEEIDAAREEMRAMMQADAPDRKEVLRQVDRIGELSHKAARQRIEFALEIRTLLTVEEWEALHTPPVDGERPGPPGRGRRQIPNDGL